jgi:Platelet-activating factor acetylhydrolase, isoform II
MFTKPAALAVACCAAGAGLLAACSAGSSHPAGRSGTARPAASGPVRLSLPAPAGPYPVGTVALHLIDHSRGNPWASFPAYRELMVSIWYPASEVARYPPSPQMAAGAAAHYGSPAGYGWLGYHVPPGKVDWAGTLTSGHMGAPLAAHPGRLPAVLYSPGGGEPRTWETILVQDLASRGYIVVTIDHPYEASEVEFPGGRVVDGGVLPANEQQLRQLLKHGDFAKLAKKIVAVRVADTRFVLDELAALDAGGNPDAERRPLPAGLAGALDMNRIGMFGVSAGGFTAAQAMDADRRIKAGIDVGGTVESPFIRDSMSIAPVFARGLDRPFLLMGDAQTNHHSVPSWKSLWDHSSGWHADLTLKGASGENSYKDAVWLLPQIARQLGLPDSFVTQKIGTVDPAGAVRAEEAYLAAFFDRFLRGQDNQLLDGPSPRYPEFAFVR